MKIVTLYHNPRCSKSREALKLLQARGASVQVVEYLKAPPKPDEIKKLIDLLGIEPHALLRTKEAAYKELRLSPASSKEEVARAVAAHPILLERPVAVAGHRAVIGRPPERVLELL